MCSAAVLISVYPVADKQAMQTGSSANASGPLNVFCLMQLRLK